MTADPARPLGEIIRAQRRLAQMSLRRLADLSAVSNPYLSQVERGLHEPSFRVMQAVADALDVSTETLLRQAGLLGAAREPESGEDAGSSRTERAIEADERLSPDEKAALLSVYRSYVGAPRDDRG